MTVKESSSWNNDFWIPGSSHITVDIVDDENPLNFPKILTDSQQPQPVKPSNASTKEVPIQKDSEKGQKIDGETFLCEIFSKGSQFRFYKTTKLFAQIVNPDGEELMISEEKFATNTLSLRDRQNLTRLLSKFDHSSHQMYFTPETDTLRIRPVGLAGGDQDTIDANRSDLIFESALSLLKQGDRENALNTFREANRIVPEGYWGRRLGILNEMAPLLFEFKAYDELQILTNGLRSFVGGFGSPKKTLAMPLYWCGRASLEQGRFRDAISYFNQSQDFLKSDVNAHASLLDFSRINYYLGLTHERLASYSKALRYYQISRALGIGLMSNEAIERILSSDPDLKKNANAYEPIALPSHLKKELFLANYLIARGWEICNVNQEEAVHLFRIAIQYARTLTNKRNDATYGLACLLDRQNKINESKEEISKAIASEEEDIKRRSQGAQSNIHEYYNFQAYIQERLSNEPSASIESMDNALQHAFRMNLSDPKWYCNAYFNKGRHHEQNKDNEEAARFYLIASKIDPSVQMAACNLDNLIQKYSDLNRVRKELIRLQDYVPYAEGSTLHQRTQQKKCVIQ